MYHAVINLDTGTVVSIEPSGQSAQDTMYILMHPAKPHLFPPVRNMMVLPVEDSIFVAYSEGKWLEFDINDSDGTDAVNGMTPLRREKHTTDNT